MLLIVKNLKKYFPVKSSIFSPHKQHLKAVDDISFTIANNEVLGLVGESGCGKSTVGKCILRLMKPTDGQIIFEGKDILSFNSDEMKTMRAEMQIIFQDPLSSLNPRMTVGKSIEEPLIIHKTGPKAIRQKRVAELLLKVGLPTNIINRYPHEFSGGQCQRIVIARALALNPKLIIADEPVSALDVSIQAQIINLMADLKKNNNLSYLFISHDISVVKHISDRIVVMYCGKIVEIGPSDELCLNPLHPYTKALLSVAPTATLKKDVQKVLLKGDMPSGFNQPSGCLFHTRCPVAKDDCRNNMPDLVEKTKSRFVRCLYV